MACDSGKTQSSTQQEDNNLSLAFPGAEGFGKYTTGGRGGEVLIVTNLNDSGPGSLREAIRKGYTRTIVFAVSGNIELQSPLDINKGNLTIAGQSAPGDGITIQNYPIKVKGDNVIIRYIRSRMGDERGVQDDAISITGNKKVIVDHCSFSWGTDEVATFYDNELLTVQYCIISESLNNSVHKKGAHGYGGIWGGKKASFHHNLFAHHISRNPRLHGSRYHKEPALEIVDFRNNVIYNWRDNNVYGGEEGNHNLVNNYYKAGPATRNKKNKILDPYGPWGTFYLEGNVIEGNETVSKDNWTGVNIKDANPNKIRLNQPIEVEPIPFETAAQAFATLLGKVGSNIRRDAIDTRVLDEVKNGTAQHGVTGNGIIDSQSHVGGWPELETYNKITDRDRDGMDDVWETAQGLNPADGSDHSGFKLDKNYTNLEVYLNSLIDNNED